MMTEGELLQWAGSIINRMILDTVPCSCSPLFTMRGLVEDDCGRCNGPDLSEAEEWLKNYKRATTLETA